MFSELKEEFKPLGFNSITKNVIEWNLPRVATDNKKASYISFQTTEMLPFGKISNVEYFTVKNNGDRVKLNTEKNSLSYEAVVPDILVSKFDSNKEEFARGEKIYTDLKDIKNEDDELEEQKPINVGECPFTPESI